MRDVQSWERFGLAHRIVTALKWGVNELKRWELPWQTSLCLCQQYLIGHLQCQRNNGNNSYWIRYRGCSNSKVTDSQKHEFLWHFICFHSFIACSVHGIYFAFTMHHVIQGKAWYSHGGVGFQTRSYGDQWWPVFEPPPDSFDVINYNWAISM